MKFEGKPFAVGCLLYHLYTSLYPTLETIDELERPSSTWELDLELLGIAEKTDASNLKALALASVLSTLTYPPTDFNVNKFIASIPLLWNVASKENDEIRSQVLLFLIANQKTFSDKEYQQLVDAEKNAFIDLHRATALKLEAQGQKITDMDKLVTDLREKLAASEARQQPVPGDHGFGSLNQSGSTLFQSHTAKQGPFDSRTDPVDPYASGYYGLIGLRFGLGPSARPSNENQGGLFGNSTANKKSSVFGGCGSSARLPNDKQGDLLGSGKVNQTSTAPAGFGSSARSSNQNQGSLFGSQNSSAFGGCGSSARPPIGNQGGLFGNSTSHQGSGGFFGDSTTHQGSGGLFGHNSDQNANCGGVGNNLSKPYSDGLLGPTPHSIGTSLFGPSRPNQTGGLFG